MSVYPQYSIPELAGGKADYTVNLTEIKKRIVPALDDDLAKDLGEFVALLKARLQKDGELDAPLPGYDERKPLRSSCRRRQSASPDAVRKRPQRACQQFAVI